MKIDENNIDLIDKEPCQERSADICRPGSAIVSEVWLDLGLPQGVPKAYKILETFLATR